MSKLGKAFKKLFYPEFESDKAIKKFKTKALIFLGIGASIAILFSILSGCIDNFFIQILLVPVMPTALILVVIGIVMLIKVHNEVFRLKRVTCSKCGTRYQFPEDVKYELAQPIVSSTHNNDEIIRKTEQRVYYNCTCSNCGNKSSFNHPITIKRETLNLVGAVLSAENYDVNLEIAYYFRDEQSGNPKQTN